MRRFEPEEVGLHMVLSNVTEANLWHPDWDLHKTVINRDGIRFFTLDPFKMTQVVYRDAATHDLIKSDWFYVDVGNDGIAVRGLHRARQVLNDTMLLYSRLCLELFAKQEKKQ